jgi:CO/xanthine dehydrogenase Mo-binding subunit
VVRKGDFVAVVADKEWNAIRGARALKVTWSTPPNAFPDMAALYDGIRAAPATKSDTPIKVGNVDDGFARAAKVMTADYEWPFQSHASMGPACGIVDAKSDGARVWSGTQKPHFAAIGVAKLLGLPPEKVRVIWMRGPGAYGRNDAGDALMDAAYLSQATGRPVRVQYMRNEGTGWDPKGPASIHKVRAGLDANGKVIAWDHLSRGFSRYDVAQIENDPGETLIGQMMGAKPQLAPAFAISEDSYDFENKRVGWDTIPPLLDKVSPLRTAHVRDPLGPQCHFASESFVDDIAAAVKADPVAFRLSYLKEERDIGVIKAAAEKVGWKAGPIGTRRGKEGNLLLGQGIAYTKREALGTTTYVCVVSDVAVDPATGRVHVRKFTVVHDCGLIINPETLKRVIEGNLVQGLSRAMHEETLYDAHAVTSVDWATYPILDIDGTPDEVDIVLVNRPEVKSSGAGEGAIRTVAASLNNAIFEATGVRIHRAPLSPARVKAALSNA